VVQEQLREKSALEVLELAARLALRGSAESWLCVVDQVVARLEPFPIKEWPVLLQLLMAAENVEVQEADFFVHCAGSLEARAKTEKLGRRADFAKQLACFADLLRLRGVWLGAVSGMIDTIEELGECITRSVSSDLSKAEATENPGTIMDESNFNIEEALLRAQRALRAFAAAVTREAFLLALEAGHTPMPSRGQVLEAAKPLEAAFPVCWLRWAPRRLAEAADLGQRGVPASEAPKLRPPTLKPLAKGDPKPARRRMPTKQALKLKP